MTIVMTAYGTNTTITPNVMHTLLSVDPVAAKKAARRKVLEQVAQRRRENYKRFYAKMALEQAKQINSA